jgi:uncharacterized protein
MPDDQNMTIRGPTILTYGGKYFNFQDPDPDSFTIEDIAMGLSNTCRFAGQTDRFYSVAQHCVHASHRAPSAYAYEALMHDAAEAFVGDMPKPLKEMLPAYKQIENRIHAVIARKFGLPEKMSAAVKIVDIRMLRTEQLQIMNNNHEWEWTLGLEPYPVTLPVWGPNLAFAEFLDRYYFLIQSPAHRPAHHYVSETDA